MPVLNWIGKDKVINHDQELPFRVLKPEKELSVGENSGNLLVEGDNLEALKALMPFYYNKVKCIYIDPPYNTGNEKWIYNDKVNSPQIKAWLNKVVGSEGEDLCRHDKWLCMMYPRLKLLHDLLSDDGAIFISIDDHEIHNLMHLMDEIFLPNNFVANIIWQKKYTQSNDAKYFSNTHDYIVCYAKNIENPGFRVQLLERTEEQNARYENPDNDPRGLWMTQPLHAKSGTDKNYSFTFKNSVKWSPPAGTFPRFSINTLKKADEEGRVWFGAKGTAVPRLKKYLNEMKDGVIPKTLWLYTEAGSNDDARRELKTIFPENIFDTPKPINLIKRIVSLISSPNDIILDSFAGSGTTAQAVLELNKEDGGNRKFILVELEREIAKKVTAKRLKKVIEGYDGAKFPSGTGGSFGYLNLNGVLYDYSGYVNPDAHYEDMAAYIYFTETKNYLDLSIIKNPYIGSQGAIHYFLFFKDKGTNILDKTALKKTDNVKGSRVIYADKCLIDEEELSKLGVTFKQIPYELKKY
jgi:DNA modification methylase